MLSTKKNHAFPEAKLSHKFHCCMIMYVGNWMWIFVWILITLNKRTLSRREKNDSRYDFYLMWRQNYGMAYLRLAPNRKETQISYQINKHTLNAHYALTRAFIFIAILWWRKTLLLCSIHVYKYSSKDLQHADIPFICIRA